MASGTSNAGGAGSTPGGGSGQQTDAQNAQAAQQKMSLIRDSVTQIAQVLQKLGQQVPEFAPAAASAIQALQKGLTVVAGNPERVPDRQAPPGAA